MANCLIAQSGGPTSVINASVAGLVEENKKAKLFDNVYAGINGIEGILKNQIINLSKASSEDILKFKYTPSSGLGSCRYKLKSYTENKNEYEKLMQIFKDYDISSFFYVGGNDSMDTIAKLSVFGKENNININFIGIPKTIDNDLMFTDHTPGFGSAAKYIATTTLETYLDAGVYINNGIFILETMGRDTGWLAASSILAQLDGKPIADFILLPEIKLNTEDFLKRVKEKFEKQNKVYIVASEGIRNENGDFLAAIKPTGAHDNFGHSQLGGVCNYLKQLIVESGITKRVKTLELGVTQRCAMHLASKTDIDESFSVGAAALHYAKENKTGFMVAISRLNNSPYESSTFLIEANKIANNVKYMPSEWISKDGYFVTQEAYDYIYPLIGGHPDYLSLNTIPDFKIFR